MAEAVLEIASAEAGKTLALCSHGNVISLFLNHLDSTFKKPDAEKIRNPDIIKINFSDSSFKRDRNFSLPALDAIATHYSQMKV
jgi:broad specificity phosphatase PhoE